MSWGREGAGRARRNKDVADWGHPLLSSSVCLLSLLISPSPSHSPCSPPGLGFLRKEFVLTTRDQEHTWAGWPGAVTAAE